MLVARGLHVLLLLVDQFDQFEDDVEHDHQGVVIRFCHLIPFSI